MAKRRQTRLLGIRAAALNRMLEDAFRRRCPGFRSARRRQPTEGRPVAPATRACLPYTAGEVIPAACRAGVKLPGPARLGSAAPPSDEPAAGRREVGLHLGREPGPVLDSPASGLSATYHRLVAAWLKSDTRATAPQNGPSSGAVRAARSAGLRSSVTWERAGPTASMPTRMPVPTATPSPAKMDSTTNTPSAGVAYTVMLARPSG